MSFGLDTDPSLIHGGELDTLNKFGGRVIAIFEKWKVNGTWKIEKEMCICVYLHSNELK